MNRTRTTLAVLLLGLGPLPAIAQGTISYQALVTPLLDSGTTIIGDRIAYPPGTAKITAAIVTVPPGGETGWHTHAVPLYAYMLDGSLTVDYGDKGTRTYNSGDSVLEAINWPHNGRNLGTVPVRLLAVYMGAEGVPNAAPVAK